MTRKQFGIIFTLMALIVCVGVLSMKLNEGGLNDPTSLEAVLKQNTDNSSDLDSVTQETVSTTEYFYTMRLNKEQQDEKYVSDMKAVTEDTNASQEAKEAAEAAMLEKTKMKDQEGRVEAEIRNKGYEDAICMINETGVVTVYVKAGEEFTEENSAVIKKVVEDITTLSDVGVTSMK